MKFKGTINYLLIILTGITLLISCNSKKPEDGSVIHIRVDDFVQIELNELLANSDIIPLELTAESIIDDQAQYLPNEDGIYIFYRKLIHFDFDGKFIRTIGQIGKGPGEFSVGLRDFLITEDGFEFYFGPQKEIYYFGLDGRFIESKKIIDKICSSFVRHPKTGDYFFYTRQHNNKIYQVDAESLMLKDSFLINNEYSSGSGVDNLINSETGTILCYEIFNYNIYEISEDSAKIKYTIDFGDEYPNLADMNRQKRQEYISNKNTWSIRGVLENEDWIYFWIRQSIGYDDNLSEYHNLVYEKESGRTYRLPGHMANEDFFWFAFMLDKNNILSINIHPQNIADLNIWNKHFEKMNSEYNLEDNHVVIRIRLNDLIQ